MSIIQTIINKALSFENVKANNNNVIFNTNYYGGQVKGKKYYWCVTFLWDVFRLCNASHIFCDGERTAYTEAVYNFYNNGRLFDSGQTGDFILIRTDQAEAGRRVNHIGLVISKEANGSYNTIEGNTNGGIVAKKVRRHGGDGYKIVKFARPNYGANQIPKENQEKEIEISAKLTVQGQNVNVRTSPSKSAAIVKKLNTGNNIQATGRVLINNEPWFHFSDGWISGNYVKGWVKDYNDNNRWWYVEKGYKYPAKVWKEIDGKNYCFGKDGYLFVNCYIKATEGETYYWVDNDGAWLAQHNTTNPPAGYRIVKNIQTENAYQSGTSSSVGSSGSPSSGSPSSGSPSSGSPSSGPPPSGSPSSGPPPSGSPSSGSPSSGPPSPGRPSSGPPPSGSPSSGPPSSGPGAPKRPGPSGPGAAK